MRNTAIILALCLVSLLALAADPPRPRITGISHVAFFTTDPAKAKEFYGHLLGLPVSRQDAYACDGQSIELETGKPGEHSDLIAHVAFATDDADGMRRYLAAHGVAVPDAV